VTFVPRPAYSLAYTNNHFPDSRQLTYFWHAIIAYVTNWKKSTNTIGADHECHTYLFSAELELVTLLHRKIFFGQKIAVIMKKTVSNIFVLLRDIIGETTASHS
jgi:hypothetical protein